MKTKFKFLFAALMLFFSVNAFSGKKITVKTMPENATIEVDGSVVGEGSYTLKFDGKNELYVVTISAPGYIKKSYRVMSSNPNKSIVFKLPEDDALKASFGSEDGSAIANSWMDIRCKQGLKEDIIWKRLMSVCTNYFDNISTRDKAAGWIKTGWVTQSFRYQVVRTRLEVRISFTDDEAITYRARIISQIKDIDEPGEQAFEPYERVLRKFEPMLQELQTTVGGGE